MGILTDGAKPQNRFYQWLLCSPFRKSSEAVQKAQGSLRQHGGTDEGSRCFRRLTSAPSQLFCWKVYHGPSSLQPTAEAKDPRCSQLLLPDRRLTEMHLPSIQQPHHHHQSRVHGPECPCNTARHLSSTGKTHQHREQRWSRFYLLAIGEQSIFHCRRSRRATILRGAQ